MRSEEDWTEDFLSRVDYLLAVADAEAKLAQTQSLAAFAAY